MKFWKSTRKQAPLAVLGEGAILHPEASVLNLARRADQIRVGAECHIRGELLVFYSSGSIQIGKSCYVGEGSRIWSQNCVAIGDRVLISHLVDIHDTDGHPIEIADRRQDIEAMLHARGSRPLGAVKTAPVEIGDDVWVGFKASILKGVHIGRGAIVAAGSVVVDDVEAFTLVAGNPAKPKRQLNQLV